MLAFHHIPKCAGSTLQKRMVLHEHSGELPRGATLIRYDAVGREWEYKVSDDPNYDSQESLHHQTFPRHRGTPVTQDHSAVQIVMGHAVDHTWPGQHITWIRNPYERDISHYNYDYGLGRINRTWSEWHDQMPPNWIIMWLYTRWLGLPETTPGKMFDAIVESKLIIRPMDQFESDYQNVCEKLDLTPLTLRDNVQTESYITELDLEQYTHEQHEDVNWYDWQLYRRSLDNQS